MYRLVINCFFTILVLNLVQKSTGATSTDVTINNPEKISPLAQCKLKSSDPKLHIGEKGQKGETGPQGLQGDSGLKGTSGTNGKNGEKGLKGDKGDQGQTGEPGKDGDPGAKGLPGLDGRKGKSGPRGPRGDPGIAVYNLADTSEKIGSKTKPLKNVCKYEGNVAEGVKHYIKSPPGSMSELWEVHCEKNNSQTCILPKAPVTITKKSDKPFWLSEDASGLVQNIYGVHIEQLQWMQRRSSFIKQTIRYYCLNSVPIHDDESKSLKLLTWNNIVIGDKPSKTTPFYYEVIEDHCKDSSGKKDEEKYIDIQIRSTKVNRLPILNFLINDVNGKEEKYTIEHVKLCFV